MNVYRHAWITGCLLLSIVLIGGCQPSDDNDTTPDVQTDTTPPIPSDCTSNDDCADEQFCSATSGVCEMDGVCKLVEDCSAEGNDYPVDGCEGTIDCVEGQCTMICDTGCTTDDDCAEDQYCNGSGVCAADGSCDTVDDCGLAGNNYPIEECEGTMVCVENQCAIDCTQGCASNDDCAEDQYCNGAGVCAADGACGDVSDCSADGNEYDVVGCIGTLTCTNNQCGIDCTQGCSSNDDCEEDQFCSPTSGACESDGVCKLLEDCSVDGNDYPVDDCVGAIDCVEGLCVMVCDTGCSTNDDCAPDEYCDASGACALDGSCTELADCSADGNEYDLPNCVGTLVCTAGLCSMDCNFLPEPCADVAGIDFGACEMVLGWAPSNGVCTFFSGCGDQGYSFHETETECQLACGTTPPEGCGPNNDICKEGEYCSYNGTCQVMKDCTLDADCAHPDNLYNKPKCFGVGVCDSGTCGWNCGTTACQNVAGVDFGPCDAELGWMVIGAACVNVSGCDTKGFQTFSTQASCEQQCELGPPPSGGKCFQLNDGTDTCDGGQFCDSISCTVLEGECVTVPDLCTAIGFLVCGCDGQTYSNECYRIKAGVSKAHDGACTTSCTQDADCSPNAWCYNPNPNDGTCLPYKVEGDACGGFPPPGTPIDKCDPGLVCADIPANLPDAKGVCRPPCTTDNDCPTSQYCGASTYQTVCRDDGNCWLKADCDISANAYNTPLCAGYSICDNQNQCGWICGNANCQDVTGIEFGTCAQFLGYIWKDGDCQGVSGCADQGYNFFSTKAACLTECGGGGGNMKPPEKKS